MPVATRDIAGRTHAGRWSGRYDGLAIAFHWLTALLVVSLFAFAQIWGFLPRGPARHLLQGLHVSLGCLLVAIVIARILWRVFGSVRLSHPGMVGKLAQAGHGVLYLLLLAMIVTGPLKRWAAGQALNVFWLFSIPSPLPAEPVLRAPVGFIHFWAAWAVIVIAGLHAATALFHHYALKDGVLRRMIPLR
ncbi:MAG TPA: cytochrome b [Acidisoma sp.]|uniref:cytochrome b n=1 Tax=Acidisoma sp. TaxID=1872115 RepID=UPI002C4AB07D|nr:cytochrome b [Acidisoma sp.]HTI03384.1 cytochrome b [Acidisoma sp.]